MKITLHAGDLGAYMLYSAYCIHFRGNPVERDSVEPQFLSVDQGSTESRPTVDGPDALLIFWDWRLRRTGGAARTLPAAVLPRCSTGKEFVADPDQQAEEQGAQREAAGNELF